MPSLSLQITAGTDDARDTTGGAAYADTATVQYIGINGSDYYNGYRWTNLTIPQGATITTATLDLYSAGVTGGSGSFNSIWHGVAIDNAATWSTGNKPDAAASTAASITHAISPATWAGTGFGTDTFDISGLVQEVVNRVGWVSGNAFAITGHNSSAASGTYVGISTYDRAVGNAAKLTIVYSLQTVPPTAPSSLTASADNEYRVRMQWADSASPADWNNFSVERKTGVGGTYAQIGTTPNLFYLDLTGSASSTYYYRVRAQNGGGNSGYSNEVNVTTLTANSPWSAKIEGWMYGTDPYSPVADYSDGRVLDTIKPEYFQVNGSGIVVEEDAPASGTYAYSVSNVASVKSFSTRQFTTVSCGVLANFEALLNSGTNQTNAITTLTNFCVTNNITGVELDFEKYSAWTATDYSNYKTFLANLKSSLNAQGKKLMVDGPPIGSGYSDLSQNYYKFKYEDMPTLVDYICVLAYDYEYDFAGGSPVAPTAWVQSAIDWAISKVGWANVGQIVIGMPNYGYHATTGLYDIVLDAYNDSKNYAGFNTATRDSSSFEMMWATGGKSYIYQDSTGLDSKRQAIEDKGILNVSVWYLGGNQWFTRTRSEPPSTPGNALVTQSDSIASFESLGYYSELVATREQYSLVIYYPVNVSDSSTTSESLSLAVQTTLAVSDATASAESLTVKIQGISLGITISDSSITSEALTINIVFPQNTLSVSDSTTAAETINIAQANRLSVSDGATTSETVGIVYALVIQVRDTVATSTLTTTPGSLAAIGQFGTPYFGQAYFGDATNDILTPLDTATALITSFVTVSDSSVTSETINNYQAILVIATSDSTATTENISLSTPSSINVADSAATSETITLLSSAFIIGVDSSSTTDLPTLFVPGTINVSDSTATTEAVSINAANYINTSDATSTSEATTLLSTVAILVVDATTTSETFNLLVIALPVASDSTISSELVNIVRDNNPNVTDSTTILENLNLQLVSYINTNDSSVSSETNAILSSSNVGISDSTTANESVALLSTSLATVSDSSTTSENYLVSIISAISLTEVTSINETVQMQLTSFINTTDSSITTETTNMLNVVNIVVNDTTTLVESYTAAILTSLVVADTVTTNETLTALTTSVINNADIVTTNEIVNITIANYLINTVEALTTTEIILLASINNITVLDATATSESVSTLLVLGVNVADTTQTSEAINLYEYPTYPYKVNIVLWSGKVNVVLSRWPLN